MSAFMVNESHIDAIVATALSGPRDSGPRYPGDGWPAPYYRGAEGRDRARIETANYLGRMLASENVRSLEARYRSRSDGMTWDADTYQYPHATRALTTVEALKAIDCYEYQACEHEGWKESAAREFCDSLRSSLIVRLPGYNDAPWGIDRQRGEVGNVVSIFDL